MIYYYKFGRKHTQNPLWRKQMNFITVTFRHDEKVNVLNRNAWFPSLQTFLARTTLN